ncbi:hypothetical protein PHISCL_00396 [Aspergillus sclerotialis]|uniref:Uncharacterized protein n=1 Tax=Aspergillus sclerotialis TaxID=2070753 RepID=A0A3A3ABA3_9EURO|nr:hypothetical protein PHISCL_00396 [Aspergillus sclerotialis]
MPPPIQNSVKTRLIRILELWPKDNVRPESVSVQNYLKSHIDHLSDSPDKNAKSQSTKSPIAPSSINALNSLLENRYAKKYPLPPHIRRPASNPDYYDNLIKEFEEAPKRDWFGRLKKLIAGKIRFQ